MTPAWSAGRLRIVGPAVLVLLFAAPATRAPGAQAAAAPPEPSVALPAELARVLADYETAWRGKNPDALAALFVEDGFVLADGAPPVRGRTSIRRHYAKSGGPLALRALAFATEGSAGYIIGGFARREGEPDIGKFTLTLRHVQGRWLIVSDMDNGNASVTPGWIGADTSSAGVRRVAWLQGCWELASPDRIVEERWMAPRGGTMLAVGRTVRGGRLAEYELVVLREEGDRLAYEAHPSGQPSAVFLSRTIGGTSVLFENPEHDFPQRIGYERRGPDALLAWIEGTEKGKQRRIEFPYKRVACDAPAESEVGGPGGAARGES